MQMKCYYEICPNSQLFLASWWKKKIVPGEFAVEVRSGCNVFLPQKFSYDQLACFEIIYSQSSSVNSFRLDFQPLFRKISPRSSPRTHSWISSDIIITKLMTVTSDAFKANFQMAGEGKSVMSKTYDCVLETLKIDASHLYIGCSIKFALPTSFASFLEQYLQLYPEAIRAENRTVTLRSGKCFDVVGLQGFQLHAWHPCNIPFIFVSAICICKCRHYGRALEI